MCLGILLSLSGSEAAGAGEPDLPLGPAYRGPKCIVTVGAFAVLLEGAPPEIGPGLQQMLRTALHESNYFLVADRSAVPIGVPSDDLLGDDFLKDPDALLDAGAMRAAEVHVSGALLSLEGSGFGLRVKVPAAPAAAGGSYSRARVKIQLQATETATGRIVASPVVEGGAGSGKASVGKSALDPRLPVELEIVRNTPLELAFRDCIYRGVVGLIKTLPRRLFHVTGS